MLSSIRLLSNNILQRSHNEENKSSIAHIRKGKWRINFGQKNTSGGSALVQEHKKKDLSKIKCFNCHTFGHYAFQRPQKNGKEKQHASTVNVDEHPP